MIQYIYFVKCPNCEDEHFDFFDDAKGFALGCLSKKPIITQTEVCRNDFGECTDSSDLGTVWSWEDEMKDTEKETTDGPSLLTKDFLDNVDMDNDPEFADDDSDFRFINELEEGSSNGVAFRNSEDFAEFKKLCDEIGIITMGDVKNFMRETGANDANILDKLREYRAELSAGFSMTEETHAKYAKPEGDRIKAFNNALKYAKKDNKPYIYGYENHTGKFFALEQPIKVSGEILEAEKEFKSNYKNCKLVFTAHPDKVFVEESADVRKPVPEGMTIEQLVETMEENEDEVECTWCNDLFPKDMCKKEVNLGYLCPRCADGIMSRGETLTFKENNYWDFLDEKLDDTSVVAEPVNTESTSDEKLSESFDPNKEVDFYYDELTFTVNGVRRDADDWDEYERGGSYTYTRTQNDVAIDIWEKFITEEDVKDVEGGLATLEDNDAWLKYLDTHFDALLDKYYDDLLDYYEDSATEKFADSYSYLDDEEFFW